MPTVEPAATSTTPSTAASTAGGDGLRVDSLWRYPVKSLQGEQLAEAVIDADGLRGDRLWGILDHGTGKILTGRREPQLLFASARLGDDGEPVLDLPDGVTCHGCGDDTDATLSAWLGRPISLVPAAGVTTGSAEFFADATDDTSEAIAWDMPPGRFVDAMSLLVLTRASLAAGRDLHPDGEWDVRRFRPNVVVDGGGGDGFVEDTWYGRTLGVGSATLAPSAPCARCTMVTRPQPGLERDLDIYKTLAHHHGATFGAWTAVTEPGTIRTGDPLVFG